MRTEARRAPDSPRVHYTVTLQAHLVPLRGRQPQDPPRVRTPALHRAAHGRSLPRYDPFCGGQLARLCMPFRLVFSTSLRPRPPSPRAHTLTSALSLCRLLRHNHPSLLTNQHFTVSFQRSSVAYRGACRCWQGGGSTDPGVCLQEMRVAVCVVTSQVKRHLVAFVLFRCGHSHSTTGAASPRPPSRSPTSSWKPISPPS